MNKTLWVNFPKSRSLVRWTKGCLQICLSSSKPTLGQWLPSMQEDVLSDGEMMMLPEPPMEFEMDIADGARGLAQVLQTMLEFRFVELLGY